MLLSRLPTLLSLLSPFASAAFVPSARSTTLIDALSSDSDYSSVLRLIQRAKLVPTLNKLNGSTLFAPTNDAIERHRKKTGKKTFWSEDDDLAENVQWGLRQHLLYHLLNYTLKGVEEPLIPQQTLHFPELPLEPPTRDPPPSPPWLPKPGGLLGGEPQRLRTVVRDGKAFVGVDSQGKGGAKVVKDVVETANGNIYGIDRVVDLPLNLLREVANRPSLSVMSRLLPSALKDSLSTTAHLTLFFPVDEAWDALDPIERRYLESGFAEDDMAKIVGLHASGTGSDGHGLVGWSETWNTDSMTNFTTIEGHTVHVNVTDDGATASGRKIVEQDIYAANGVLHIVDTLLLSNSTFRLNAEKYLLALNATSFVSVLRAANLSHYVDDYHDGQPWTILAPRDDVFSIGKGPWNPITATLDEDEPQVNMTELRRILQYHFIPGKLQPQDLSNGALLGTELKEEGLNGGRQLVEASVHGVGKGGLILGKGEGEIGFGGAVVIGDAVEIGESIIYVLSKALTPPTDIIEAALPSAHFSTFLTSVFATHLDDVLRNTPTTTVLIPHNDVWGPLGLLADYLLLPEGRELLKSVVSHHVIKDVIYPNDGVLKPNAAQTYSTLEGSDVRISGGRITGSGGWSASTSDSPITIVKDAILTRSGVIHEVGGGLLMPRSVQINIGNLATAGQGSIMIGLIQKAGYGGVLNGTMRLDLDEWEDGFNQPRKKSKGGKEEEPLPRKEEVGWTLLCPRDSAFKNVNLTRLLEDEQGLKEFVRQHIIPLPSTESALAWEYLNPLARASLSSDNDLVDGEQGKPLPVSDEATYSTLHSANALHGDVVFRLSGTNTNSYVIGIKGAKGKEGADDFAKVIKWGRTVINPSSGGSVSLPLPPLPQQATFQGIEPLSFFADDRPTTLRSGVVLIDRPLTPYIDGWWAIWGQAVAVGVVGSLSIMGLWAGIVRWWRGKEREATFEPLGGHGTEDD